MMRKFPCFIPDECPLFLFGSASLPVFAVDMTLQIFGRLRIYKGHDCIDHKLW